MRGGEQIDLAGKPCALGVDARQHRPGRAAEIQIQAGGVVVSSGSVAGEQRAETAVGAGRRDHQNRGVGQQASRDGGSEEIVLAIKRKHRPVELLTEPRPRRQNRLD